MNFYPLKITFARLGLVAIAYTICRILFFLFNLNEFEDAPWENIIKAFVYGWRFDFSIIFLLNSLFTVMSLLPFSFVGSKEYQFFLKALFLFINVPFIFLNLVDVEYFTFRGKRTTAEILSITQDILDQSPQLALHYWHIPLIGICIAYLLFRWYPSFDRKAITDKFSKVLIGCITLPVLGVYFIIIRGGLQLKPIFPNQAFVFTPNVLGNLVLNTPFSLLHTFQSTEIEKVDYFQSKKEMMRHLVVPESGSTKYYAARPVGKPNVVIIILESFSSEYTGFGNPWKGYSPFLDSLSSEGLFFSHHMANGTSSMEGLPSVVASIPSLMHEYFITSMYMTIRINGLGGVLKREGYHTSFFHGGTNGTMGFDVFAKNAGFENTFGRNEYPDSKDFDGTWGIYDDKFMQFFCKKLSSFPQPFASCIFTLSSHQPYSIPDALASKFPRGKIPILKSVGYTDYSLKLFFESAKKQPWFNNTLFVITADHTQEKINPRNLFSDYHVPLLFYCPGAIPKRLVNDKITEHVDILPSVLDFLNVSPAKVLPFGHSVFDARYKGRAVNFDWGTENVWLFHQDYVTTLSPSGKTEFTLSPLAGNVASLPPDSSTEARYRQELKAFVQYYRNGLVDNQWVKGN